jgi:hypothetical protein
VHVFTARRDGWKGVGYPTASLRVMDDDTFARGRHNRQEGGPKGIDLDPRTNVLAVTAECLPLAFFDLEAPLASPEPARTGVELLRYELEVLAGSAEIKAAAAEHHSHLLAGRREIEELHATIARRQHDCERLLDEQRNVYESSRSWRLTKPVRAVTAAVRHLRGAPGDPVSSS